MDWQTIREKFPHTWLVVEATDAHTERGKRVLNDMAVLNTFDTDSLAAWNYYVVLHKIDRFREYYFLHTDRQELNIEVRQQISPRIILR